MNRELIKMWLKENFTYAELELLYSSLQIADGIHKAGLPGRGLMLMLAKMSNYMGITLEMVSEILDELHDNNFTTVGKLEQKLKQHIQWTGYED